MAVKKMGSEGPKVSRVTSNSPRMAARRRTTARAQARTRQQMLRKPTTVTESGVGNIPMTIARGVTALIGRATAQGAKTVVRKPSAIGGTSRGVSRTTGGALSRGKPAKYGPKNKKLSPQQKAAQTRAMNKWRTGQAAQAKTASSITKTASSKTKAATQAKSSKVKSLTRSEKAYAATAAAGAVGGAAYLARDRNKGQQRRQNPAGKKWNGTRWVSK